MGFRQSLRTVTAANRSTRQVPQALQSRPSPCWHRRQDTHVAPPCLETICLAATASARTACVLSLVVPSPTPPSSADQLAPFHAAIPGACDPTIGLTAAPPAINSGPVPCP